MGGLIAGIFLYDFQKGGRNKGYVREIVSKKGKSKQWVQKRQIGDMRKE